MSDPNKITGLIRTEGTTRVYQMDDGSVETREGGTVSWRNNNPGNLKFEYANSADKTVHSGRTKDAALAAAQGRYQGVVALDQWGNAIFETEAAGRAAKGQLLRKTHGDKSIPEMLKSYAVDDYTGKANTDAYARSVYAEGDRQGVDLRDKKIKDLSPQEFEALLDGMKRVEGFREGTVTRTRPHAEPNAPSLRPEQQPAADPQPTGAPANEPLSHRLSLQSLRLIDDSQQHVRNLSDRHQLPWDQGMDNTVHALALQARKQGMTGITHLKVEHGQIHFVQFDGVTIQEGHLDARAAANTDAANTTLQMAQLDHAVVEVGTHAVAAPSLDLAARSR